MDRVRFQGVELAFEVSGEGEPFVLLHARPFVRWYEPLVPHLAGLAVLRYARTPDPDPDGRYRPLTAAEDAALCGRLLDHLGWDRAHVAGHSYGALVALQLALDDGSRVASAALLEPAARAGAGSEQIAAAMEPVTAAYRSGDRARAVDLFLQAVCGPDYREPLERAVPGALDDAVRWADLFFQAEMPAVRQFRFGAEEAARVAAPVLDVLGSRSAPRFAETSALVRSWFPGAEHLPVPGATHLLMVQQPEALASGLAAFVHRHPLEP
jgi:pimeloyl-ACP methyl ester carboxylesterase